MGDRCFEDALIGANLKKFREVYQIKRKELAEIFHISEDGVYRIERGETGLSSSYAYILAQELHCDMNFIYGNTPEPALLNIEDSDMQQLTTAGIAQRLRVYAQFLEEMNKGENQRDAD